MVDPQTANLQLFVPVNGADPGSWDTPANANSNQLDAVLGQNASIALTNLPITLSPSQYNTSLITFTGTLTGNVTVTFPPFGRNWTLFNNCLASVNFSVTCKTSISTIFVALPPGEPIQVFSDGTNMRFMGLGRVGQYLDIASTAVPVWITATTPQPYLNCDGTTFSSATYPALRDYLGSNTLPDSKGRFRATLGQGSGRLTGTSTSNGLDGTTFLAGGGNQIQTVDNLPPHNHVYNIPSFSAIYTTADFTAGAITTAGALTTNTGSGLAYAPPSYVGGLTLIRAG